MKSLVEVKDNEPIVLNVESIQNWISIKDFIPAKFTTHDVKGDYYGRYWCLVEREYIKDENSLQSNISHIKMKTITCELCYWNNLANRFQDENNEWVKVTHWCQVPNLPKHNIENISREDMIDKINNNILSLISHENQKRYCDIENMWNIVKRLALYHVSLDEKVYLSSTIDENDFEDCMWCVINNN